MCWPCASGGLGEVSRDPDLQFMLFGPASGVTSMREHSFAKVSEVHSTKVPALVNADWESAFPWLIQGTTTRGEEADLFDLGLFSSGLPKGSVRKNWARLLDRTDAQSIVHAPQVHGSVVRTHQISRPGDETPGAVESRPEIGSVTRIPVLAKPCDGHLTADPGVLLAVATADCVPVFAVDPGRRAVGAIHAGWRGAAAGVLENALAGMVDGLGCRREKIHLHLGPAICGECYEVGPEVFESFGQSPPTRPSPIDLREILAVRAVHAGVPAENVTISAHCTLCTGSSLFSHRGGDSHRQVGYVGVKPKGGIG